MTKEGDTFINAIGVEVTAHGGSTPDEPQRNAKVFPDKPAQTEVHTDVYGREYDPTVPVFLTTGTDMLYDRLSASSPRRAFGSLVTYASLMEWAAQNGRTPNQSEIGTPPAWWLEANRVGVGLEDRPGIGGEAIYQDFRYFMEDDMFTFTRAGDATYVDSDGMIITVAADEPRIGHHINGVNEGILIESDPVENVVSSNTTGADRSYKDITYADGVIASPIGPATGILWSDDGDDETGTCRYQWSNAPTVADWYTFSMYIKRDETSPLEYLQIRVEGNSVGPTTHKIRLSDMTTHSIFPSDGSTIGGIEATGYDGWYRVWLSRQYDATETGTSFRLAMTTESSLNIVRDGTNRFYSMGDQIEVGKYPTSLILTSGAAVTRAGDVLTIEPEAFPFPEETTSNYFPLSEDYHSSITKANVSTVADATTAPDGTMTAEQCIENLDTVPTGYWLSRNFTGFEAGNQYCVSQYWKANERSHTQIILTDASFGEVIVVGFELSGDGTALWNNQGTNVNYGIEFAGDGWYRCWLSAECTTTAASAPQLRMVNTLSNSAAGYIGDGTSSVYIWGGQLEIRSSPSRYIPTNTVTPVTVTDVQPLTAMTFGLEGLLTYDVEVLTTSFSWLMFWGSSGTSRVDARFSTVTDRRRTYFTHQVKGGTFSNTFSPDYANANIERNMPYNTAMRYTLTDMQVAADGQATDAVTYTTGLPDAVEHTMSLVYVNFNGTLKRFRMWDTDIGEAGIIEATE